jgi:hypothetical protein
VLRSTHPRRRLRRRTPKPRRAGGSDAVPDKWTAFLMSLLVPGSGQLAAGHISCLLWFAAAGIVIALPVYFACASGIAAFGSILAWLLVAVSSAEHAKRCLEARRTALPGARTRQLSCRVGKDRVSLRMALEVPRRRCDAWADVSDFSRFVCIDPFHHRVVVFGGVLRPGAELGLEHRAFGFRLMRFGRLLKWRDGYGYVFSDMSSRGPRHGFPHVFFVDLRAFDHEDTARSLLTIDVRGKWTARWVPRFLRTWWLWCVLSEHARLICKAL